MDYISIDIETSGLLFDTHKVLEIGAVAVSNGTLLEEINILVKHDEITFSAEALAIHRKTGLLKRLETTEAIDEDLARDRFRRWIVAQAGDRRIQWAGKNVLSFDMPFLKKAGYLDSLRWGHRLLDPGSMWARQSDQYPPDLKECCVRAGVEFDEEEKHTALPESKLVARCIQAHFKRV